MSRGSALLPLAAFLLTAGCGGNHTEAPPTAAAPAKPAVAEAPAPSEPAPAPSGAPAVQDQASAKPASSSPKEEPAFTPGTSLPGAIPPAPAPAAKTEKPQDPLVWMQEREARRTDYTKKISETEASLAIANAS